MDPVSDTAERQGDPAAADRKADSGQTDRQGSERKDRKEGRLVGREHGKGDGDEKTIQRSLEGEQVHVADGRDAKRRVAEATDGDYHWETVHPAPVQRRDHEAAVPGDPTRQTLYPRLSDRRLLAADSNWTADREVSTKMLRDRDNLALLWVEKNHPRHFHLSLHPLHKHPTFSNHPNSFVFPAYVLERGRRRRWRHPAASRVARSNTGRPCSRCGLVRGCSGRRPDAAGRARGTDPPPSGSS